MANRSRFDDAERVQPATAEEWAAWLEEHHRTSGGAWLVSWKKATGRQTVSYEEAITEALRFGWIDSIARTLDDERTMLWFGPRRPGSGWARSNKERIARLEREGRLEPAGAAVVAAARADGSWTMLDDVEALVVPPDLDAALARSPEARSNWDAFPPSVRRAYLWWIVQAKRPETRRRRIEQTAVKAARNERPG